MKITMTSVKNRVACVFNGSLGYGESLAQAIASCSVAAIYRIAQDRCIAQVENALICVTGNHVEGATLEVVANITFFKDAL